MDGLGWIEVALRAACVIGFGALAVLFGGTLRAGRRSLIEQIARIGIPDPPPSLCRYTRGLTALWAAWFVIAGLAIAFGGGRPGSGGGLTVGAAVWAVTIALFVGENLLRRHLLFRSLVFPGVVQQVRDTMQVWRPRR